MMDGSEESLDSVTAIQLSADEGFHYDRGSGDRDKDVTFQLMSDLMR